MRYFWTFVSFVKAQPVRAVFFAIPLLALIVALSTLGGNAPEEVAEPNLPLVRLVSLAELSNGSAALPLIGIIESTAEADIQTQKSGTVTSVRYELGDFVPAGAVIATLQNQSEQAAVAQARAALASAEASFAETLASTDRSTDTTRDEALHEYRDAYTTATDAIENKTEPFFTNDRTAYPNLVISGTNNSERLEDDRAEISTILRTWERALQDVAPTSDLILHLGNAIEDLRFIETFLNDLSSVANRRATTESELEATDADRAALLAARTNVSSQLAALISVHDSLRSQLEAGEGGTGETQTQIAVAEANVAQAEANLNAALASLEETIVRSPIAGYLNALPLKAGQSVGSFAAAATVINPDALEIVAFISPSDRTLAAIGDTVTLSDGKTGVITNIAPGASSRTGKIEIRIAPQDTGELTVGNSVSVSIQTRARQNLPEQSESGSARLPITAIKFKSDEAVIFTVNDEDELVDHVVSVGQILGSSARVSTNLPPETRIVVDARGLVAGDAVEIAE